MRTVAGPIAGPVAECTGIWQDPTMITSPVRSFTARVAAVATVAAIAVGLTAGCSDSDTTSVTVNHPAVPAPTLLAQADGVSSVGDVRLWNFDGTTSDGEAVTMDWIMTTTAVDVPEVGLESRFATGVFTFADGDQLMLEGVAHYPTAGSVLEAATSATRIIVGGTGTYAGASGTVESTHLDDDTWRHVFTID